MTNQVGDARVVRFDEHNYIVERFDCVKSKDGHDRFEWRTVGYYGGNLVAACKGAASESIRVSCIVTKEDFAAGVQRIVEATEKATARPRGPGRRCRVGEVNG